jgi:hypothetical protein
MNVWWQREEEAGVEVSMPSDINTARAMEEM